MTPDPHHSALLSQLPAGQAAHVVAFDGGHHFRHRVISMGLNIGCTVRALQNGSGPMLVAVGETRIALGRGMAEKIRVIAQS